MRGHLRGPCEGRLSYRSLMQVGRRFAVLVGACCISRAWHARNPVPRLCGNSLLAHARSIAAIWLLPQRGTEKVPGCSRHCSIVPYHIIIYHNTPYHIYHNIPCGTIVYLTASVSMYVCVYARACIYIYYSYIYIYYIHMYIYIHVYVCMYVCMHVYK